MPPPPQPSFSAPIIHKTYDFYLSWHLISKTLPKIDRYCLGTKCDNLIVDFFILLFKANRKYNYERINLLNTASDQLDLLKVIIRLLKDSSAIEEKEYLLLQIQIQEIGCQLGGWIKNPQKKNSAD